MLNNSFSSSASSTQIQTNALTVNSDSTIIRQNQIVLTGSENLTITNAHWGKRIFCTGTSHTITFNASSEDDNIELFSEIEIYRTNGATVTIETTAHTMEFADGTSSSNFNLLESCVINKTGTDESVFHGN
jgi:hypothetical protein